MKKTGMKTNAEMKNSALGNGLYSPRTLNQKLYVDLLMDRNVTTLFGLGPAGCGKTLFACNAAVHELKNGLVDHIVITRPLISVDEELGFLPGTLESKMDPWTRPIFDILREFYSGTQIRSMCQNGVIQISPLAFMRGRTFKRSFIIADEMQNSSPNQMKMMLTRLGENSRMVITGDLKQSDRSGVNGLEDFIGKLRLFQNETSIKCIEMENVDIQRSDTVSRILDIYDAPIRMPSKVKTISSGGGGVHVLNNGTSIKHNNYDLNNDAALIPKHLYK
jgi:phosphate starvation-inducible PhoH-like protein